MACRGVYFALTDEDAKRVLAVAGDAETDKAWDAMHRCLTDGRLSFEADTPRAMCVLGGRQLHDGDDYIVSFVTPEQVRQVAAAIRDIDETWMRQRYLPFQPTIMASHSLRTTAVTLGVGFRACRRFTRKPQQRGEQ